MKSTARKVAIFTYTLVLLVGAILLFMFTIRSENNATVNNASNETTEEIILPSGTKYKTVEYGQSFSIYDLFSIAPDDRLNLTINTSDYSITKVGTTNINVTFKKNDLTSNGLIRLTVVDTQKPVIKTQDITIYEGEPFNALAGVTAEDKTDKDLTNKLVVKGTVDTGLAGEYKLSYEVKDSSGNTAHSDRNVSVIERIEEASIQQISSTEPTQGSSVTNATAVADVPQQVSPTIATKNTNEPVNSSQPVSAPLVANSLIITGVTVPYQNGGQGAGQSIIDGNSNGTASTWGGAPVQSGSDGMNTHFIGHNPGIFSVLFSVGIGTPITVTDSSGQATTYTVNNILHLDDYGNDLTTKVSYWDLTVGTGGGERITLQTCITDSENLMVFASK